jgi:hypothetical protein
VAETVRIRGLRELNRALAKAEGATPIAVREGLKKAAVPVVEAAKAKEGKWAGASIGTIGPRVTGRSVFVTQRKRKVTGLRPDFGALQMREAFIPALDENEDEVVRAVEAAIDTLIGAAGL